MDSNYAMRKFQLNKWIKYIVLKVGMFETEIIDEKNFDATDKLGMMRFQKKYTKEDDYVIVKIEM